MEALTAACTGGNYFVIVIWLPSWVYVLSLEFIDLIFFVLQLLGIAQFEYPDYLCFVISFQFV